MSKQPIRVLVTGAAGQITYSLLHGIGKGDMFGADQPIILHLLDIEAMISVVKGVVMELEDCSLPLLYKIIATHELEVAFRDVDVALLIGSMPRREGMERKDLLKANVRIFKQQGDALEKFASRKVKVLVVGNPANTNALIASKYAPSLPKKNFSSLTRLDHNRARAKIAARVGVSVNNVKRVVIWGNHSNTQFVDASNGSVITNDGKPLPVYEAVKDDAWLQGEFLKAVQVRGAEVIKARKLSSAMSAAKAITDHMRDWWLGTNEVVSMGVLSDGNPYNIPPNLMFSFPVTVDSSGEWQFVAGFKIDNWAQTQIKITTDELLAESTDALAECETD